MSLLTVEAPLSTQSDSNAVLQHRTEPGIARQEPGVGRWAPSPIPIPSAPEVTNNPLPSFNVFNVPNANCGPPKHCTLHEGQRDDWHVACPQRPTFERADSRVQHLLGGRRQRRKLSAAGDRGGDGWVCPWGSQGLLRARACRPPREPRATCGDWGWQAWLVCVKNKIHPTVLNIL